MCRRKRLRLRLPNVWAPLVNWRSLQIKLKLPAQTVTATAPECQRWNYSVILSLTHFQLESSQEEGERLCFYGYSVCLHSLPDFDWDERRSLCTCLWENVCFGIALLLLVGCGMRVSIVKRSQERTDAKAKNRQKEELTKKGKRDPRGVAHQKLHICFQFPATIPETKSERSHRRPKLAHNAAFSLLHHPVLPFSRIIFSFTGKEHVWSPPLLETRPASEVPPARQFSPLSLSVRLHRSTLCGVAQEERKDGKGPTVEGLRCGIRCQSGASVLPSEGSYYVQIGFPQRGRFSPLINKTSHPFALIPQAAHMQECATQGKSYKM